MPESSSLGHGHRVHRKSAPWVLLRAVSPQCHLPLGLGPGRDLGGRTPNNLWPLFFTISASSRSRREPFFSYLLLAMTLQINEPRRVDLPPKPLGKEGGQRGPGRALRPSSGCLPARRSAQEGVQRQGLRAASRAGLRVGCKGRNKGEKGQSRGGDPKAKSCTRELD